MATYGSSSLPRYESISQNAGLTCHVQGANARSLFPSAHLVQTPWWTYWVFDIQLIKAKVLFNMSGTALLPKCPIAVLHEIKHPAHQKGCPIWQSARLSSRLYLRYYCQLPEILSVKVSAEGSLICVSLVVAYGTL